MWLNNRLIWFLEGNMGLRFALAHCMCVRVCVGEVCVCVRVRDKKEACVDIKKSNQRVKSVRCFTFFSIAYFMALNQINSNTKENAFTSLFGTHRSAHTLYSE